MFIFKTVCLSVRLCFHTSISLGSFNPRRNFLSVQFHCVRKRWKYWYSYPLKAKLNRKHTTQVLSQPVFHLDLNFSRFKYQVTLHILNLKYEGAFTFSHSCWNKVVPKFSQFWNFTNNLNMSSPFPFKVFGIKFLYID